mmetsp:Transcript_2432/g.6961  ORF Transcript_2432/g.6961 Transcript_2432/m.6961 type:complete len:239 (+) Transcript_2432:43-759(+)
MSFCLALHKIIRAHRPVDLHNLASTPRRHKHASRVHSAHFSLETFWPMSMPCASSWRALRAERPRRSPTPSRHLRSSPVSLAAGHTSIPPPRTTAQPAAMHSRKIPFVTACVTMDTLTLTRRRGPKMPSATRFKSHKSTWPHLGGNLSSALAPVIQQPLHGAKQSRRRLSYRLCARKRQVSSMTAHAPPDGDEHAKAMVDDCTGASTSGISHEMDAPGRPYERHILSCFPDKEGAGLM